MIAWVLILFGVCMTISKSKLFKKFRVRTEMHSDFLGDMVNCPMCISFWVSIVMGVFYSPFGNFVADGFFAVGCTWVLYSLVWALALHDESF